MKQAAITFTGIQGRKSRYYRLESGDLAIVKRLFKIGNGWAIYIPTEWLALLDSRGILQKGDFHFAMYADEDKLTIEPLSEGVEGRAI